MLGAEAYISALKMPSQILEEVREPFSGNLKKRFFKNGIVDISYSAHCAILVDDDTQTYTDCILIIREKAVDTEETKKSCCPLRRVSANLRSESPEEDAKV